LHGAVQLAEIGGIIAAETEPRAGIFFPEKESEFVLHSCVSGSVTMVLVGLLRTTMVISHPAMIGPRTDVDLATGADLITMARVVQKVGF